MASIHGATCDHLPVPPGATWNTVPESSSLKSTSGGLKILQNGIMMYNV